MNRVLLKKLSLVLFIFVTIFVLVDGINFTKVKANDFSETISWKGQDLGYTPQMDVSYESKYVPFENIIDDVMSIDLNKTYVIQSAYDLYMLSERSRGIYRSYYLTLDYVLGRNIDYYEIVQQNISNRFVPIGFIEPFSGTFDGQGYEITNLFFQTILSEESYNEDYAGLRFFSMFSRVSTTGVIKNLGLINPIVIQPIEWGIMEHVSYVAGENFGLIENIYVIDTRLGTSGLNVEGSFRLSGLVSINRGTFRNSYLASPHVKSNAVVNNLSVSPVTYLNLGTLQNVYYDESIYEDADALLTYGTPLTTQQFQNGLILSDDWFFNDHYLDLAQNGNSQQVLLNNTYPRLQGLSVDSGKLLIENAVDFVYMNELLKISGAFRSAHYHIISDIDMYQVSTTAYKAASVGFDGVLSSAQVNGNKLYQRDPSQGGDINYYTILNLSILTPTEIGNFTSYALFASLFGRVENINFVNFNIKTSDITSQVSRSKILVATIAAQMSSGTISNVHVQGDINVEEALAPMTLLYVGGLVAEGSGAFHKVSTHGHIRQSIQTFSSNASKSSTAGLIAVSSGILVDRAYQAMDIVGLSFNSLPTGELYLGGIVGYGKITTMQKIIQAGYLMSHLEAGYIAHMHAGGIIGEQTYQKGLVQEIYNQGNIDIFIKNPLQLSLSSYGYVNPSQGLADSTYDYRSITNTGRLRLVSQQTYTTAQLQNFNIQVSGIMRTNQLNASFQGIYNERNFSGDLALISRYAGLLDIQYTTESYVKQAYQMGDIYLQSTQSIVHQNMHYAGAVLGSHVHYEHVRNDGDIDIHFQNAFTQSLGQLFVYGVFERVSQNRQASDIYNGGNLTVTSQFGLTNPYEVFVSGITHQSSDTNLYTRASINHQSIERLSLVHGALHNALNDGNILISGRFNASTRAAGIVMINETMLTQAINLGDIEVDNQLTLSTGELAAAGIAYLHAGAYAQTIDAANYGQIESRNLTNLGFSHAAGIVLRNDLNANLSVISTGSLNKYSKIMFSINYGDVYAYHSLDETLYTITQETRSKASGIFAIGLATVMNTINYGNVYGNTLASGIFGFIYYNRFGVISANQVFIANNINYGVIRQITDYTTDYVINPYNMPIRQPYLAFGALIGKVHTGLSTWEFISLSPTVDYAWDLIGFGHQLSFDPMADVLGNHPSTTVSNWLAYNASSPTNDPVYIGNDIVLNITSKFSTVKTTDTSRSPLNAKEFGGPPRPATYGASVKSYTMDESFTGVFSFDFIFRQLPARTSGTDQYLRNYFTHVELDRVNPELLSKIEAQTFITYPGLYVMSNRQGITQGALIPNHIDLVALSPYDMQGQRDYTWLGSTMDNTSVSYKLQVKMQQIIQDFASSIYDLELIQEGVTGGLKLNQPVIDEARAMITYYLPSNASIINQLGSSDIQTSTYIEASEGVTGVKKVPDYYDSVTQDWVYHYVGDFKRVGNNYIPIGAHGNGGMYHVNFNYYAHTSNKGGNNDRTIRYSGSNLTPAYTPDQGVVNTNIGLSLIYTHVDHVKVGVGNSSNFRMQAPTNGNYRASVQNLGSPTANGFGAYRLITYSLPSANDLPYYIDGTYQYAGANKEPVTYVSVAGDFRTVYQSSSISFGINTNESAYRVSQGASLTHQGVSMTESVSIPRSVGVYDLLYDFNTNALLDSFEDHYGLVRVFSTAYNAQNPATFKDYQVRIVRTAFQFFDALTEVKVDGQVVAASYSNFREATIGPNNPIHFEHKDQLGVLTVSYRLLNVSNVYDLKPFTRLYRHQTNEEIDDGLFRLDQGLTTNPSSFNNLTGAFGYADVNLELIVDEYLASGRYRLEITLITDETAYVIFDKKLSSNGSIIELIHQDDFLEDVSSTFTSYIPYGMYYDESDPHTQGVNFTNLNSLQAITSEAILSGIIPSYLDGFSISPFSTLNTVELTSIFKVNDLYVYQIIYVIEAEDGTLYPYTHYLYEKSVDRSPNIVYKDGGQVAQLASPIVIKYNEAPTIRVELDLGNAYIPNGQFLNYDVDFTPLNGGMAMYNQDYYINYIEKIGYQLDLTRDTPIGLYDVYVTYQSEVTLWDTHLSWHITFDTLTLEKLQNDQSMLINAYFVSDQLFSGFNTIVDIEAPTESTYLNQLMQPELRKMSVLPTTGIFYGIYANLSTYWIIGQVQRTNLSAYAPQFELPDHAIIRRVVNPNEIGPEYQSTNLFADFSLQDDVFNFIHYRVYAQDYNIHPSNYTDYYIAVQDVTNNIKFNLTVVNTTDTYFDRIFTKVNVCRVEEDELCTLDDYLFQMSVFSYYDEATDSFNNNQFQTSQYGTYVVHVDLPQGFSYYITLQTVTIDGSAFYLEDSILPRKYYVTVYIQTIDETRDWGHNKVTPYRPYVEVLDPDFTYLSGMRFNYDGITWEVRDGYTYTFDSYNPPGSSPWLGIRDITETWNNYSTYLTGDIVSYLGVSYLVRHNGASGIEPSLATVSNGTYFEISEVWLPYNIYVGGEIVSYNDQLYQASYYNQNQDPELNSGPYQAWVLLP